MTHFITILTIAVTILISCNTNSERHEFDKKRIDEVSNLSDLQLQELDRLTNMVSQQKWNKALLLATEYLNNYPNEYTGKKMLGTIYLGLNSDSMARDIIGENLRIEPDDYSSLTEYGVVLDRYGEYGKAKEYYDKSISVNPKYPQTYSNYMGNRVSVKDYVKAKELGETSVSLSNNLGDRGILCAIYHKLEMAKERDSLLVYLEENNYKNIGVLKELFKND